MKPFLHQIVSAFGAIIGAACLTVMAAAPAASAVAAAPGLLA
jgi:hypothetical protein